MYLPAVVSVSFYFERRRALTTGIVVCGTGVGCFLFAPLFEAVLSAQGWKYAMVMLAAITLQGAVFGSLLRPLKGPSPKQKKTDKENNIYRDRQPSISDAPHHVSADPHLQSVREAKEEALRKEEEDEDQEAFTRNGEKKLDVEKQDTLQQQGSIHLRRPSSITASSMASLPVVIHGSYVNISRGSLQPVKKKSFLQTTGLYMLADPLFLIPILANLIAMLGHYIPFFFIVQRSVLIVECTQQRAALLLSVIGKNKLYLFLVQLRF